MIEINLLPQPEGPDSKMKKLLAPSIVYFLDLSFEKAQRSQTDQEMILWGKIWASLLHLRREYLQPGFSRADNFAEKLIQEGVKESFSQIFFDE